jgi:hypothetical protein
MKTKALPLLTLALWLTLIASSDAQTLFTILATAESLI